MREITFIPLNGIRYASVVGKGTFLAGHVKGNDDHYVEQHERSNATAGTYQKRVSIVELGAEHLIDSSRA